MNNNDTFSDELGENHIGTSVDNPVRKDAFDLTDDQKIELIKKGNQYLDHTWNGFE